MKPMLCHEPKVKPLVDGVPTPTVPEGEGWMIERKLDGWRFLFESTDDGIRSYAGRNGSDRTGEAPEVERALAFLPPDTVLDGELLTFDPGWAVGTALALREGLYVVVFDLLAVQGSDLTTRGLALPWGERRQLLEVLAGAFDGEFVRLADALPASQAQHDLWLADGAEGSVVKRVESLYRPGQRSWDWLKLKPQQTCEAIVRGWEWGKGEGNRERCGALKIELVDPNGQPTGVMTTVGHDLDRDAANRMAMRNVLIEIRHHGIMPSGKPRHPVFSRTREDLEPGRAREGNKKVGNDEKEAKVKPARVVAEGAWMRNYGAMGRDKLMRCIGELKAGEGDAVERVLDHGGSVEHNLAAALNVAARKGWS